MTVLLKIVRSGLTESDEYQEKRGVVASNYLSLILIAAIVIVYMYRLIFYGDNLFINLILGLIVFICPIICNKLFLKTLSRLLLCFLPVAFIWFVFVAPMQKMSTIDSSLYDGLRIYLLGVCFIPYLLFDKNKLPYLIAGILPTLSSFLFFDDILTAAGIGSEQFGLNKGDYQLMHIRTLVTYSIISSGCYAFHSIITQNDIFNQRLLSELKNSKEEIEAQNNKLVESQGYLNKINNHLEELVEEKVMNIKRQNEILTKYAYTNAHHVRGPVARILGLIQLSKIETDLSYPWFFDKVEHETNEIDKIINRISKDLDETNIEPGEK